MGHECNRRVTLGPSLAPSETPLVSAVSHVFAAAFKLRQLFSSELGSVAEGQPPV